MRQSLVEIVPARSQVTERHSLKRTLVDELTGLYNGDALVFLGSYHARLAQRTGDPFALIYVEVVDLESRASDNTMDATLRETAELLLTTFRSSDICARLEGSTFAVLLSEATRGRVGPQIARLRLLERHEVEGQFSSGIVLRTGVAAFEPGRKQSFEGLLDRARSNTKALRAAAALKWARSLAATPDEARLLADHELSGASRLTRAAS